MLRIVALYIVLTATALAQVPAVNSGTATYPSSGSVPGVLTAVTGSIGGGVLTAGTCAAGAVSAIGSTTSMAVAVSPNSYPGDGTLFYGYVSVNNTVTVKVCALVALTPSSSTYNVRVMP